MTLAKLARKVPRRYILARHWFRRRLTPAGMALAAGMLACGAIGVDFNESVGAQAFALLACLLTLSALGAAFFRGRFVLQRSLPRYASVGQAFQYRVRVHNQTPKPLHHLELHEDLDLAPGHSRQPAAWLEGKRAKHHRPLPARFQSTPITTAAPNGWGEGSVWVMPLRRGLLSLKGAYVTRPDPLGLVRGGIRVPKPESLVILPNRYPLPDFTWPGIPHHQPGGVSWASSVGSSDQFTSLRDYRPGDPPRHVHWKSWAHANKPIVKEFQDEFFVRHALLLDTFDTRIPDQERIFEEAVSVAASFACHLTTEESLLDLLFVGPQAFTFTVGRGVGDTEHALEILASVQPCRRAAFDELEALVCRHAARACVFILIFLDWDHARQRLVQRLRQWGIPVLVLVVATAKTAQRWRTRPDSSPEPMGIILEVETMTQSLQRLKGWTP